MSNIKKPDIIVDDSYMQIKEAINAKIGDILKDYYIVPRFQRKYVWTKNEVTEFFNDINENPPKYFIGSLVLYDYKNEDNERLDVKGIVDGQQRLTTILIMLVELRRLFHELSIKNNDNTIKLEAEKKYKGTYSSYIKRKDNDDNDRYILISETSKDYLEELFSETLDLNNLKNTDNNEEKITLYQAYKTISQLFEKQLANKTSKQKYEFLVTYRAKIENLLVIKVLLDDLDSAHIVFDSLNDRGKPIDVADKVKSYLMRLLKKGSLTTDSQLSKWNTLQTKINTCKKTDLLNEFIEYHFRSITNKNIDSKNLFDEIKKYINKDRTIAAKYLEELKENINYYLIIYDPNNFDEIFDMSDDNSKRIKRSINTLNNYGIKMHIPLLILLIREYKKGNLSTRNIASFLEGLDKFHFRYNTIYSFPTNALAPQYKRIISNLNSAKNKNNQLRKEELISHEKHNITDKTAFINNFKNKILFSEAKDKNKKIVKEVLIKLDSYYRKPTCVVNYDEMTIEHLIPQERENSYDISQIGNLILVNRDMQEKLGIKSFDEKLQILENEAYYSNYKENLLLPTCSDVTNDIRSHIKCVNSRTDNIINFFFDKFI